MPGLAALRPLGQIELKMIHLAHPSRRNHSFILRAAGGGVSKDEGMVAPQDEGEVSQVTVRML